MGAKIPEPIRRKVLREWVQGIPGRQIARDNQIGTGTVSEIIKAIKERDSEAQIDTLRETAMMLRREGLSIDDFAQSIHLKQFLNKIGLNDEQLEDFIRPLEVHCFKRGLTPEKFMNLVQKISSLSDNLGIPVEVLPERINGLKRSLDDISFEIRDLIIKKSRAISSYNTTVTDLEEYRRNRPLIETLKAKDEELERERERRNRLESELLEKDEELERERERRNRLESELLEKEYEWSIHEDEIKRINEGLDIPMDIPELYELSKDLFHHPSKHADVIRTMRQRSGPQATLVDTNKVNVFNPPPPPPAYSPATLSSLPPGTPIYRTGTANQNPTQPTQSELAGILKGVNPGRLVNLTGAGPSPAGPTNKTIPTPTQTNKILLPNPSSSTTNILPFNISNPIPPTPTQQNTTTAITPSPPPSATTLQVVNPAHHRIMPHQLQAREQTITQGFGQGTDNSTRRSNPIPPPTQQDTNYSD
jgi:hypothetical protein